MDGDEAQFAYFLYTTLFITEIECFSYWENILGISNYYNEQEEIKSIAY